MPHRRHTVNEPISIAPPPLAISDFDQAHAPATITNEKNSAKFLCNERVSTSPITAVENRVAPR